MADLDLAVQTVVERCLAVQAGEEVLVVADPGTREIGEALRDGRRRRGRRRRPRVMDAARRPTAPSRRRRSPPRWPPPTSSSRRPPARSRTPGRARPRREAGARGATLPGVTADMLARLMAVDFDALPRAAAARSPTCSRTPTRRTSPARAAPTCGSTCAAATGIPDDGDLTAARRVRQPAVRRGLHRAARRARGVFVRSPGRDRARAGRPGRAHRRGRPPRRRHAARRASACSPRCAGAGEQGTNLAELGVGTNEQRDADRQRPRGREDPRHRPRRLRRERGDRRHRVGARPPGLRRARRRRSTSAGTRCSTRAGSCPRVTAAAARRPQRLRGPRRGRRSTRSAPPSPRAARGCSTSTPTPTTTAPSSRSPAEPGALAPALARGRARGGRADRPHAATTAVHPRVGAVDVAPVVLLDAARPRRGVRRGAGGGRRARARSASRSSSTARSPAGARAPSCAAAARRAGRAHRAGELRPTSARAPHPTAGAVLVAARPPLVAFNLELAPPATLATPARSPRAIREGGGRGCPGVRAIGLELPRAGRRPGLDERRGPPRAARCAAVVAAVRRHAPVRAAELVGLAPARGVRRLPGRRAAPRPAGTIEHALATLD